MAFFELDDVFGYQDANDIKKLWAGDTAPAAPGTGEVWLDTSSTPNQLKRYNGSSWDTIGELTAGDLLNLIKTVDGSGSGLDADKLDGQEGIYYSNADNLTTGTVPLDRIPTTLTGKDADKLDGQEGSYYRDASNINSGTLNKDRLPSEVVRTDQDTNVSAHTEWQDTYQVRLGNGADLRLHHNGTTSYFDNYTGHLYIRQLNHGSNIYLQAENASGTNKSLLTLDPDAMTVKSEGSLLSTKYQESLAANDVLETDLGSYADGMLIISISGPNNRNGAWLLNRDGVNTMERLTAATIFTNVKDTASKINVYYENGKVNIQNKTGSTYTVYVGFFGAR